MNWELLLVAAVLVAIFLELRRMRRNLAKVETRIRERNEALLNALAAHRRHVPAISEFKKPGSRLSNAKINWP